MSNEFSFDPQRNSDLARLRMLIAGMIKDLVAARAKDDPDWCEEENIDRIWFFSTERPVTRSAIYLLGEAERRLRQFHDGYSGPLSSVPCETQDIDSPIEIVERLRDLISQFTNHDELSHTADQIRQNQKIKWESVAHWHMLPDLRSLLDELPDHSDQTPALVGDERLSADGKNIYVGGHPVKCPKRVQRLLHFLLRKRNRSCHVADLGEAVWNDHARQVSFPQADDVLSEARKWLGNNNGILFALRRKDVEITLKELPPDPDR